MSQEVNTENQAEQQTEQSANPELATENTAADASASIEEQLNQALAELEKARQDILYVRAEAENARRRALDENDKARKFAIEKFAREIISVKDAIDMALLDQSGNFDGLKMGVDLTAKALTSAFEKFELVEINPMGEKLDPNKHQAISMVPSDEEANTVVQVMQKGYELAGRILRPAMVVVAAAK
ncbi:nucleotide exchange factor GrpE [Chitinibacter tainanensis]|uniref:nucleotide exchange factor GrpE n=1 Tax=Chitinibacter tainanensis TaxID=230667 RepID=UPI0004020BFD|nr:nucleotide exchange factor GrpE [Chitinibacter tainanensis]